MHRKIAFTRLSDGTTEDYRYLEGLEKLHDHRLADDVLALLKSVDTPDTGYPVSPYRHCLQTATRAYRDGADEETVVVALLHDMADRIAPQSHGQVAADILGRYVSERNRWVVETHPVFQGYYYYHHVGGDRNARDRFRGHPHFQAAADFCERWDQVSFDPDYDTMPLAAFEPMVRRLFQRTPFAAS